MLTIVDNANPRRAIVVGEIDSSNADELVQAVSGIRPLMLDLSGCSFLCAAGITGLLQIQESVGDFTITAPSDVVLRVLDISGMTDAFQIACPHQESGCATT